MSNPIGYQNGMKLRPYQELERVGMSVQDARYCAHDFPKTWSNYLAILDRQLQYWFGP